MVRTYIRKGGHSGDRSKAGLLAGYWQDNQGGRAAAAAAKACSKGEGRAIEEEAANAEESFHGKRGGGQISSHTRAQKGYLLRTTSGSSPKKVVQERNNGTDLESCRVPP